MVIRVDWCVGDLLVALCETNLQVASTLQTDRVFPAMIDFH